MTELNAVLDAATKDFDNSLERLFKLVRIPSISTDPAYAAECEKAANAIVDDLHALGFKAQVRPTPGRPMVCLLYTSDAADD